MRRSTGLVGSTNVVLPFEDAVVEWVFTSPCPVGLAFVDAVRTWPDVSDVGDVVTLDVEVPFVTLPEPARDSEVSVARTDSTSVRTEPCVTFASSDFDEIVPQETSVQASKRARRMGRLSA